MSEQHDKIETDESADTEAHRMVFRRLDEAGEDDMVADTEGHGRFQPTSPAGEPTAPKGQRGTSGNG